MFWAWLNEEEKKWWKMRDAVHEAKLLRTFGGLNCYDPDTETMFKVHKGM